MGETMMMMNINATVFDGLFSLELLRLRALMVHHIVIIMQSSIPALDTLVAFLVIVIKIITITIVIIIIIFYVLYT
jgi:hypothetical protein